MYLEQDFDTIRDAILAEVTPDRIVLFGSYAKGSQTKDSDIDIMILLKDDISRKDKLNLLYRIEKRFLKLPYSVDIVLKSRTQFEEYKEYLGTLNNDVAKDGKILWMQN